MRASFLLVLTLAVLVGLAVAVGFRYSGLLNPPAPALAVVQPVVEKVVVAPPPLKVLATTRNVFAGDAIESADVYLRPATPAEARELESHPTDYLPPMLSTAYFRTPTRNLMADTLLKKTDLEEMAKPESLNSRLAPGTRAFGVSVTKLHSVGGLIQVGDWVDVYVTTDVSRTDLTVKMPHTGLLVKAAQVVAKRDTLHKIYSGLTSDLIQFTLAANPYRTALMEYGRSIGALSLMPVSADEKKKLDGIKDAAMKDPDKAIALSVGNTDSREGREELQRVKDYEGGSLNVGVTDLMRILDLKPIPVPPPPPTPMIPAVPPPPPGPTTIEIYNGATKKPPVVIAPSEPPPLPPTPVVVVQQPAPPKPGEYVFTKPVPAPPEPKSTGK